MARKTKGPPKVPLAIPTPVHVEAVEVEPKPFVPRRRIRPKPLAALLVLVALIGVGVHFLHAFQTESNAQYLLARADEAEKAGELGKAVGFLRQYVGLVPDDLEANERYALMLDQTANTPRAKLNSLMALQRVLLKDPDRDKVRRAAVEAALAVGQFPNAKDHIKILLPKAESSKDSAALKHLLGNAEEGEKRYKQQQPPPGEEATIDDWGAEGAYQRAIADNPRQVKSYVALAYLYRRRLGSPDKGNLAIEDLNGKNLQDTQAQIAYIRYLLDFRMGEQPGSGPDSPEELLDRALVRVKPLEEEDPEVVRVVAESQLLRNRLGEARLTLEKGLAKHRESVPLYHLLARVELQEGRPEKAAAILGKAQEHLKDDVLQLWATADLLVSAGVPKKAEEVISKITPNQFTAGLLDYLKGRLRFEAKEWASALALFDNARHLLQRFPEVQRLAHWRVGLCHRALENPDAQLLACDAALESDPTWVPALVSKADALAALGKTAQARALYEGLAGFSPAARYAAVRQKLATGKSGLVAAEELLNQAPEELKQDLEWKVSHVSLLAAQAAQASRDDEPEKAKAKREQALKQAREATKDHPQDVGGWLTLASLTLMYETPKVPEVLDEAEKAVGLDPALWLARLRYLQGINRNQEAETFLDLCKGKVDKLSPPEQVTWWRGLAGFRRLQGKPEKAEAALTRLLEIEPNDLVARIYLFESALPERARTNVSEKEKNSIEGKMRGLLEAIHKVEGPNGAYTPYGEALLILLDPDAQPADLRKAGSFLAEARLRRPSWVILYAAEGDLARRQNNDDGAIAKYEEALDRGDQRYVVLHNLLALYNRKGDYKKVAQAIRDWRNLFPDANAASRLEVQALLRHGDGKDFADIRKRIEEMAKSTQETRDYRDFLGLGQMYWALALDPKFKGDLEKAHRAFRDAISLAPKNEIGPRVALVVFLAGTERPEEAKKEIEAIEKVRGDFSPDQVDLGLAACYEAVGDTAQALKAYQRALQANGKNPAVLQTVALHHLSKGEGTQAEAHLRTLIDLGGESATWARRILGLTLAATGEFQKSQEGLTLIRENLAKDPYSSADQRAKALILAQQPVYRAEAIQTLETAFNRVPATPAERFLLARLYRASGNWKRAEAEMIALLGGPDGGNPTYLATFIRWLLEQADRDPASADALRNTADAYLKTLEAKESSSLRTLAAKVRVRSAEGADPRIIHRMLEAFVDADRKDPGRLLAAGQLLDEVLPPRPNEEDKAERYYREYYRELGQKDPKAVMPLVRHLAQTGRVPQSLDELQKVADRLPPDLLAQLGVAVLRATERPNNSDQERVEGWLKSAAMALPGSPVPLLAMANLRDQQGRIDDAEKTYRFVMSRDPRNVIALNNLAVLLALHSTNAGEAQRRKEEALVLIQEAIRIAGPVPELLDTRAVVLLRLGQTAKAIRDLEEVLVATPTPAAIFRLAWAHLEAGDRKAAEEALKAPSFKNLKKTDLHPLEHRFYQRVMELQPRG